MKSLVRMLFNTAKQTWHPIFYLESPFPGPIDEQKVARLKSKMHHTSGFSVREDAVKSINDDMVPKIKEHFPLYNDMKIDIDIDQQWDGLDMPVDVVLESVE